MVIVCSPCLVQNHAFYLFLFILFLFYLFFIKSTHLQLGLKCAAVLDLNFKGIIKNKLNFLHIFLLKKFNSLFFFFDWSFAQIFDMKNRNFRIEINHTRLIKKIFFKASSLFKICLMCTSKILNGFFPPFVMFDGYLII